MDTRPHLLGGHCEWINADEADQAVWILVDRPPDVVVRQRDAVAGGRTHEAGHGYAAQVHPLQQQRHGVGGRQAGGVPVHHRQVSVITDEIPRHWMCVYIYDHARIVMRGFHRHQPDSRRWRMVQSTRDNATGIAGGWQIGRGRVCFGQFLWTWHLPPPQRRESRNPQNPGGSPHFFVEPF